MAKVDLEQQQKIARWVTAWALILTGLFALVVLACAESQGQVPAGHCDLGLWKHVYRPARLKIVKACLRVTGTLVTVRKEADGDEHWQLQLDPGQESLLNARNVAAQKGRLVIEPICTHPVTQSDAIAACKGFRQSFPAMKAGVHVQVTGPYVEDQEANHGWRDDGA